MDHRTPMDLPPLILAAATGNAALVSALLERGANVELTDHFGCTALHWMMRRAFEEPNFNGEAFAALYERLAPPSVDVKVGDRLVRLDRHLSEYFLFQTMWALFKGRFSGASRGISAFNVDSLLKSFDRVPPSVLNEQRRERAYISSVLSRNEVNREYAYNRRLFTRMRQGWYQFNPELSVRVRNGEDETWTPIYTALNLPLIKEFSDPNHWPAIDYLLAKEIYPTVGIPVAGKLFLAEQPKKSR